MAEHANSTTVSAASRPRQVGPVTQAIRNIRGHNADPIDAAIQAIEDGLERHFAEMGLTIDFNVPLPDLAAFEAAIAVAA